MRPLSSKPSEAAPARVAPLARVPVFLDLHGKTALVVGDTEGAMWKAELLLAAGAHVQIHAPDHTPGLTELLTRDPSSCSHRAWPWSPADLAGRAIAVADIKAATEADAFFSAARAAGVPVNMIDQPEFCTVQFGAIVNRSPVVIGISTAGAAPVLGQVIRRRIETLIPATIAGWAALAQSVRAGVAARLPKPAQRRAFWEKFAESAFTRPVRAKESLEDFATVSSGGRVTLVGAGPGDAELLTLKAMRALQSADVILFDDLVSDEVLELARREAKRMLVGKRGGRESCRQDEINTLMVNLAQQGKHVVRLKSGDPMIFGRAGEEIAQLRSAGIPVDVVPGITAALAMASALGISLTHRDHAQSLRLVTGHGRNGELPDHLDWRGLADPASTLVFYMGGRTAPRIATRLLGHGLPAETPVVIVSALSRPEEQRWSGRLTDLTTLRDIPRDAPVLIGIGRALSAQAVKSNTMSRAA